MTRRFFRALGNGWFGVTAVSIALFAAVPASAESGWITDSISGCRVWTDDLDPNLSVTWTGSCKDGLAEGQGTLKTFQDGKVVAEASGGCRARPTGTALGRQTGPITMAISATIR